METMKKFLKWLKSKEDEEHTPIEWVELAWQESAKQAGIKEHKKLIDEIRDMAKDSDLVSWQNDCKRIADRLERS